MLSSGKKSDYYIDVRRVSLSSRGLFLISTLVWEIIKSKNITAIGGPTLGADPIVGGVIVLAQKENRDLKGFLIRKSPKKYGRQKMIEGPLVDANDSVAIIDDVATSGASLIRAIEVLSQEGIKVKEAIAVVDREEGAGRSLSLYNCPLTALFSKRDFL